MANNPYAADIKKAEKAYAVEVGKLLTTALRAKDVQKKADAKTSSSAKKAPKEVVKIFETALKTALRKLPSKFQGLKLAPKITYQQKGTQWIATVTTTASFTMTSAGGASYVVKPGDTLWAISKTFYGAGRYWPVIAAENPAAVKSKGNFILAGVGLKIPKIDIPAGVCEIPVYKKTEKPEKTASKVAKPVMYPTFLYDLSKSKSVKSTYKTAGATIVITTSLKGELKIQKTGKLPANFNLRSHETEIAKGIGPFTNSIKITGLKPTAIEVGSSVSGTKWKSGFSLTSKGTIKVSLAPKSVKFKQKDVVYEGNVGIEVEIQVIPDPVKEPVPVYERAWEWLKDSGVKVAGVALLGTAAVIVVGTVIEDVLTVGAGTLDDPVSFATAAAMARQGLVMIK
jgi:LysM repeat protein